MMSMALEMALQQWGDALAHLTAAYSKGGHLHREKPAQSRFTEASIDLAETIYDVTGYKFDEDEEEPR